MISSNPDSGLRQILRQGIAAVGLALALIGTAGAAPSGEVRGLIADHCIECHRVPGFAEEARNPALTAPDFQTIADDRKTYTTQRLEDFLSRPHFPMRQFILSERDIQNLILFIEGLRSGGQPAQ